MIVVLFHPAAEQEMDDAREFYDRQIFGLGTKFLNEVEYSVDLIQKFPKRWPIVENNIHKYHLQKFPYHICYEVYSKFIHILAIAHEKRDPNYWKDRL